MKNLLFAFLLFSAVPALCQYDPSNVSKKAKQLYTKAMDLAANDQFRESIQMLQQAVSIEPAYEDAYLSIAGMYGELKMYRQSIENYDKAKAIDSAYFVDYSLPYSINLAGAGEFQKALDAVNTFLTIPNLNEKSRKAGEFRRKCYQFALDYAASHQQWKDYKFEPVNLGDSINSEVSEYFPTISLDGDTLTFTRRVNHREVFFQSTRNGGIWSKAKGLPGRINMEENEAAQTISLDGQILIFTGCNYPEGLGSCDLYISYMTPEGWSAPENLGDSANTEFWESGPSLSPDGRDLYFSSNRPGGYGGKDIYVCHRLLNGHWSAAENVGPVINSAGDESTPFIHADNQSFYFNSNGHQGYGDFDLFLSKKKPDGTWSVPENLGYPINTIEDEGSLVVAADGKTAYFASDRADSKGGLDLYTFQLRSDIQPARTLWVKGKVFDKKTGKGLPCSVELTDLGTRTLLSKVQTDETGNYLITLPVGKDYAFEVSRRGYLFYSENFPLSTKEADSTYHIDIPLEPLAENATIVLKNIFFNVNRYDLQPQSQVELDKLVQFMKENPSLVIQISGHTDNTGNPADNMRLSENRARSVVTYLSAKGIDSKRLMSKGWGDTKPIADNHTEQGRAQNRRTELKLVSLK